MMNEPTSVMDAYSLIKILSGNPNPPEIQLVVNNVRTEEEGHALANRLNDATTRFLGRPFKVAGIILHDFVVGDAIRARRGILHYAPDSAPAIGLRNLARTVVAANKAREHGKPMDRSAFELIAKTGSNDENNGDAE
jgi:flagellar biosynthesis protein FlhG